MSYFPQNSHFAQEADKRRFQTMDTQAHEVVKGLDQPENPRTASRHEATTKVSVKQLEEWHRTIEDWMDADSITNEEMLDFMDSLHSYLPG